MKVTQFEQYIALYERDIYNFCRYLTSNSTQTDDLYQDTMLKAFEKADDIDPENNPKSYLLSIAAGIWKNTSKRLRRQQNFTVPDDFEQSAREMPSYDVPADRQIITQELDYALTRAITSLDAKFRIPIVLYYLYDHDLAFISAVCRIPAGTVKSRLHKARNLLKDFMTKEGYSDEK